MKRPLWVSGLVALVAVTPSCERAGGPVAPPLTASSWANEPAGFEPLTDYRFDTAFSPGEGVPLGDGWYLYNPNGYATQVSDPAAPLSPPNVGQWRYPVGFEAGDAPAVMYRPMDATRELYFTFAWKASNPWQGHPSGANEIAFVIAENNILVVQMKGDPGGPYDLMVTTEFTTSNGHLANSEGDDPGARHLFGNVNGGNYVVTPGQWYQIEVYFKMSTTSTSRDGIVRWWVNGTPVGDYTTVNFDAAHPFEEFHFSPTWGGIGGTKTEEDYFWYDHVRLSGGATSPPPVDSPPPPPPPPPADPPPTGSSWANEPAGFAPLTDYGFNTAFSPGQGVPLGDGWYLYNPNGYATQVSDPAAPLSPPNVGQWRYPVGFEAGDAPAVMYRPMDATRELYFAFAWKASNPWQGHPSGANEIAFAIAENNILVVQMKGDPGGPYDLMVTTEFTTSNGHLANSEGDDPGARHLFGNVNGGNYVVTPGQWYQIEVYFKMSTTSTSRDGIVRWWVNGTPVGDYTTVNFDVAHPFEEFHFSPTWGGIGGTKTEEDYFWYDHVRLSGVATPTGGP